MSFDMKENRLAKRILAYTLLLLGGLVFLIPFAFSFVNEFKPVLGDYKSSILITLLSFWIAAVMMLISYNSKKLTIVILIISILNICSTFTTSFPKYLIYSSLALIHNYFVLIEPCLPSVAVLISSILFLIFKKSDISYFLSLIITVTALFVININLGYGVFSLLLLLITAIPFAIVHYNKRFFAQ